MSRHKGSSTLAIVLAVVLILVSSVGVIECSRLKGMKDNLPEYVVAVDRQDAIAQVTELAIKVDSNFFRSEGYSNSLYLPFSESYIVLLDTPYHDLKKHDFIGYVNDRGTRVFHRLVKNTVDGWVAHGDNNAVEDDSLVTEKNYLGILHSPIITWEAVIIK